MVCWSIAIVSPAKAAEQTKMPFGCELGVGRRKHVLDGGQDPYV